jgi:hypothetical protein
MNDQNLAAVEDLVTIDELAEILPWSVATFRRWRSTWPNGECTGPKPVLVRGRLLYSRQGAIDWMKQQIEKTG